MPQIQAGQVQAGQSGAPELYGVTPVQNNVPFQEKLMKLFKPQEFVTIKNIDSEDCYWQYLPLDGERESFDESGMQKIIDRDKPEMWVIPAGATEVIVGASAYRCLDVMYKNYSAKATLRKFKDPTSPLYDEKGQHLPKNFNFADSGAQDAFIRAAYLGKATPVFDSQPAPAPVAQDTPDQTPQTPPSTPVNPPEPTPTTPTPAAAAPQTQAVDGSEQPQIAERFAGSGIMGQVGAPTAPTYAEPDAVPAAKETVSAAGPKK